jgi:hypothetical protein
MTRAQEYRTYAEECMRIAQQTSNPDNRISLIEMAQRWSELAEKAEKAADDE